MQMLQYKVGTCIYHTKRIYKIIQGNKMIEFSCKVGCHTLIDVCNKRVGFKLQINCLWVSAIPYKMKYSVK